MVVNASDGAICPHVHCKILPETGVNAMACITTLDEVVGNFVLDTTGCTDIGTGTYRYGCTTAMPWAGG